MKPIRARWMALASLGLALAASLAPAKPLVKGADVRAFLGGRTGKLVYIKDYTYRMYYLDFNDSVLIERLVSPTNTAANPMISWDGSRVLYERGGTAYVSPLAQNPLNEYPVVVATPRAGQSIEPHWWVHPQTAAEYVTYTLGDINDARWPPPSGGTNVVKIVNNAPVGSPTMLLPFQMSTGRSRDGKWGASSHHSTGMYQLDPARVDSAFRSSINWMDSGSLLACNASISPSLAPARQNRMMHLTSGQGLAHDSAYDNHKAVFIRGWNDPDIDHPFWYMGLPGDNCDNDGSGNLFWGFPEWSTDEAYFTVTGSKDVDVADSGDLYIVRIDTSATGKQNRLLRVLQGGGVNIMPHLWVKNGVLPAKIRLDKSALSFASLKKDSLDPPADTVHVSNTGDGTLPSLSLNIPKADTAWLKVALLDNGTNSPRLVTRVLRAGIAPGSYSSRVTVSYGLGTDSAAYTVSFLYSDPVLTRLAPKPVTAVVVPGDTVQLAADPLDQTGKPFPGPVTVTWAGSSGLRITSSGKVTADSSQIFQSFSAYGTSGGIQCTTTVVVPKGWWRYAADSTLASKGWLPDTALLKTVAKEIHVDTTVRLDSAADPAPAKAYRTYRKSPTSLRLNVPNNRYHVRLHFSNLKDTTAKTTSALTVSLEGKAAGSAFAAPKKPAGAVSARVYENDVTVSDSDGLSAALAVTDAGGYALSAVEAYSFAQTPVQVHAPNGAERLFLWDSIIVRWTADTSWVRSVGVQLSVDSGATWIPLTRTRSVAVRDPDWGRFAFRLPDSLDGKSLVSTKCMVSVYEYFGADRDRSDRVFRIDYRPVPAGGRTPKPGNISLQSLGSHRFRILGLTSAAQATATAVNGHRARTFSLASAPDGPLLDLGELPNGLVALRIRHAGGVWRRLVLLSR